MAGGGAVGPRKPAHLRPAASAPFAITYLLAPSSLPTNIKLWTCAKSSKHFFKKCYGWDLSEVKPKKRVEIKYLLDAYKLFPGEDSFFLKNNFFNKLAGNDELMKQIKSGTSEEKIRLSWEPKLNAFKAIRKKYLLYKDFE
ncbi:DUF1343 domain-containing protein [archaeon]|nr:MAG: DUF1343 domain-containing protein [archaeon]